MILVTGGLGVIGAYTARALHGCPRQSDQLALLNAC
jgi:nucleoside-diphosphate-sugar epimerase